MNPKRVAGIDLKRFENSEEVYYIFRNDESGEYYRFSEPEEFIWGKLDGDHTTESIVEIVNERFGDLTVESLEEYLKGLESNGLIEGDYYRSKYPDEENLMKNAGDRFSDLLSIKFPMVHPDDLCDSMYKRVGWLMSKWMAPIYVVLIVVALVIFVQNYSTFTSAETIRVWDSGYLGVIVLFAISIPMMIIHEFSHALACKKFNRHVWEMGFMLYLIQPCLYCDTSDAWFCEKKSERIFVSFAGPFFTLIMSCGLILIWEFVSLSPLALITVQRLVYFNLLSVLLGFNPLILMDGYYMFMDLLDAPNLRTESFGFLRKVFLIPLNTLRGRDLGFGKYTKKERTAYSIYGGIAGVITGIILIYSISIYVVMWDVLKGFVMGIVM